MNEVLNTLTDHRSIRSYTDEPVSDAQIDQIIQAVQSAPTSINGQQVTVITVQDKERKKKISELAGGQPWIDQAPVFLLFCADFNRAKIALEELNNIELKVTDGLESVLVGAVDAGIALGTATAAAESLGLGTVPIGAVRGKPDELIELLELPKYVFPVSGLVIGHPADRSAKKPRLPQVAVHHKETYQAEQLKPLIEAYDEQMSEYMKQRTNGKETRNWSQGIAAYYQRLYYPHIREMLEKQGFNVEK
ncbi:NADPH-dependent oxidoreductase [Bacillus sp. HU-1818]|uniref:NADPH-dependent oxidoreductase n=1 Tax=Bacillus sp. HU-1818 TaxID=2704469 RepID=UPI001BE995B2|nr:NADPH-dependent oxidoreductase [Bacillus sp. HU-1818]MBT2625823.1 NADPH-dependent oxidoreductase [Bacillus sp. ISL-32]MCI3197126.1 NADPH-dependent oxidoreductase [Bacillus sp. HU-1818]